MACVEQLVNGAPGADEAQELVSITDSADYLLEPDVEVAESNAVRSKHSTTLGRRPLTMALAGGLMALVGLGLVMHGSKSISSHSVNDAITEVASVDIDKQQPSWQIVTKERALCSSDTESCFDNQCCKVSGHKCYLTSDTVAKCMAYCTIGKDSADCTQLQKKQTFEIESSDGQQHPADSMFCFAVYTKNTGSPKKSSEKELLTRQHSKDVGIFKCEAFAVYSDVTTSLGGGLNTVKVSDVEGDFHFAHRKKTDGVQGPWVNTGMFKQVWKAISKDGKYKKYDWTVKVDPDAVFVASRLKSRIRMIPRPTNGIFLVNCKAVDYGFFGNLEVFSSMAFGVLVANVDKCSKELPWKVGIKNGEYGPMGEDLFAEICMEKNGVAKVDAFDISIDGACAADRPYDKIADKHWHYNCDVTSAAAMHPFKKPDEWFSCLANTMKTQLK